MAKIILFSIHDYACSGIRALGGYLKEKGHSVNLCFLGTVNGLLTQSNLEPGEIPRQINNDFTFIVHSNGEINIPEPNLNFEIPTVFLEFLSDKQPDIIGYSCRSILDSYFANWFQKIKLYVPHALLIAGGFGPTLNPERYLRRGIDCVVRGEGEETLDELAKCVDTKQSWKDIDNLVYMNGNVPTVNPLRPLIKNLDELPMQMRNDPGIYTIKDGRLSMQDPLPKGAENRCFLSRGCVGTCSYCSAGHWFDEYKNYEVYAPKYRFPSNEAVIEILKHMKQSGAKSIGMEDDFFIRPFEIMDDFFKRFKKDINLPLYAYLHPIFLKNHPDFLSKALDSGLAYVNLPVQSADPNVNTDLFNRQTDLDLVLKCANQANDLYIPFVTHFIDGFMDDTVDMDEYLQKNIDFIQRLPKYNPGFTSLIRYSISYLRLYNNSPLLKKDRVKKMDPKLFFYRSMLMLFAYIFNKDELQELYENKYYRNNPAELLSLYNTLNKLRHDEYIISKSREFAGKEVFIWGCGNLYTSRKALFLGMNPQAIVTDIPVNDKIVDNLHVSDIHNLIKSRDDYRPIFICVHNGQACARKLKKFFSDYPNDYIINYDI